MKKGTLSNVFLILVLLIGLSLLLYPSFSDWWNSRHQSRAIAMYTEQVAGLNNDEYDQMLADARLYNETLLYRPNHYVLTDDHQVIYDRILDLSGTGIMGYVEIPSINVHLPIYHGTDETVLQIAIGHLDWTSLPTGGESTHCVISGHRGLPSAKLFTDLDQLTVGDYFMLNVLDEELTYEVDQILIVEPQDTEALLIQEGKDLCTLVTCTPYGINSHRLLVRGHRTDSIEQAQVVRVTADAVIVEKLVVAPFVLVPILLVMLAWLLFSTGKRKK